MVTSASEAAADFLKQQLQAITNLDLAIAQGVIHFPTVAVSLENKGLSHINFNENCGIHAGLLGLQVAADAGIVVAGAGLATLNPIVFFGALGTVAAEDLGYEGAVQGRRLAMVGFNAAFGATEGAIADHEAARFGTGPGNSFHSILGSIEDTFNPITGTKNAINSAVSACIK
jgi:hypothetical protein